MQLSKVFDNIMNSLRTCSLGPRLQSGLSAGIDLTNSIHFWPNLEKKKSLDGIIMGRHSGCSWFGGNFLPFWQQNISVSSSTRLFASSSSEEPENIWKTLQKNGTV